MRRSWAALLLALSVAGAAAAAAAESGGELCASEDGWTALDEGSPMPADVLNATLQVGGSEQAMPAWAAAQPRELEPLASRASPSRLDPSPLPNDTCVHLPPSLAIIHSARAGL